MNYWSFDNDQCLSKLLYLEYIFDEVDRGLAHEKKNCLTPFILFFWKTVMDDLN